MIVIDGSEGEGGGQIVRSSLALAAVTGQPMRIENIRGKRTKPGLLRQHLAGVRAISQIAGGELQGGDLGSCMLQWHPGTIQGGDYQWEVGSAGSAVLVAQTVLPVLLSAKEPSKVTIGGGTHASWAPPFEFFQRCYLPLLAKLGGQAEVAIEAHGFYPAGGGRITMQVQSTDTWRGLALNEREGNLTPQVYSLVSCIPESVGQRECDTIMRRMKWPSSAFKIEQAAQSGGPGNAVMIECGFGNVTELFVAFGKIGVKAEHVARTVCREAKTYLATDVPVGPYLADQLLLPMGMAAAAGHASEFRTVALSQHSLTHIEILRRFLDVEIEIANEPSGSVRVTIGPASTR
jgi:RNA 3'-terminal phosphate cyclase (ATP)